MPQPTGIDQHLLTGPAEAPIQQLDWWDGSALDQDVEKQD